MRFFSTQACILLITPACLGQTTLFQADLNDPAVFTLNTSDAGSSAAGANTWVINDVYTGGGGSVDCSGVELPYSVPATTAQPGGINGPNGAYLHVASVEALNDGIECCSFVSADGFCTQSGYHFARMTDDVSTLGSSEVNLSFWWLCNGGNTVYGEVYYSLDGGTEWVLITSPVQQYRNTSSWTQQTLSLPIFAEQSTLRFGFRFVNQESLFGGSDPGFAIDDVRITASSTAAVSVSPPVLGADEYCIGLDTDVSFTATGPFEEGNIFSVELSDANGSFAASVSIGFVVGQGSATIPCTWPWFVPPGSGYRIRIVSDSPVVEGPANSLDISLFAPPSAGISATVNYCTSGPTVLLFDELGGSPDVCGTWSDPFGQPFDGTFEPGVDEAGSYSYITDCGGPCPPAEAYVLMVENTFLGAGTDVQADLCANGAPFSPYGYINAGATTGQFLYQGAPFPLPDFSTPGTYDLDYVVPGASGCVADSAAFTFTVIAPPNAGLSVSHTTCINYSPFNLLTLLSGAEEGGVWTDPDGDEVSGLIDPAVDPSGLYTYTVQGTAPCADDQSFVALVIDPCSGIVESGGQDPRIAWLGGSGDEHEFRLDDGASVEELTLFAPDGRAIDCIWSRSTGRLRVRIQGAATGPYTVVLRRGDRWEACRFLHQDR